MVFVSADNIFQSRKLDLEKLAAERGIALKIYDSLDQVTAELLLRKEETERSLIEMQTHRAVEALEREMANVEKWLNLNRFNIELLRERYPARDYKINPIRIVTAAPTLGGHQENERVGISAEVEVQIIGIVVNRSEIPRHAAYMSQPVSMPGMDPYASSVLPEINPSPTEAWNSLGVDKIELETEASVAGPTYTNFQFRNARLRGMPPTPFRSRLQLNSLGSSVKILLDGRYRVHLVSVKNIEGRFENICPNVKAELTFVYPHTGTTLKVSGFFVTTDSDLIKTAPMASISLAMLESAQLALLARNTSNQGFCTFTTWPFDPDKEKRLSLGEWHVHIDVTSDVERDRASAAYIVQLNPDSSSAWSPWVQPA